MLSAWMCRVGVHKLRWEPSSDHAGYWQLMCRRCRSMLCFTSEPDRRLGKGLPDA